MFLTLKARLKRWETRLRESFGQNISTPKGRRAALWHFHLMDHAFLRIWWTNLDEVTTGVWRSNQPSQARVRKYAQMGIKTIIYLRGHKTQSFKLLEEEACEAVGIGMKYVELASRSAPKKNSLLELLDIFDSVDRPFLMHCKSGADRAGLASALYLLHVEKAPLSVAREQLSFRYLHIKSSKTGVLDHLLDTYEEDTADAPMPIREWVEKRYDQEALAASFAKLRGQTD